MKHAKGIKMDGDNTKKSITCCFSGHRRIPGSLYDELEYRLSCTLESLVMRGFRYFVNGGALGFDTMSALLVLKMKNRYPDIKLIMELPCRDQDRYWRQQDKEVYAGILAGADEVLYTADSYYNGCMHERNRRMIDRSSVCICYLTEDSGGTYYTVMKAHSSGLEIINMA